ncbi:hypothetical protein NA57DRAFT_78310 [Rhizodiscina lignyota]|uniref:ABM domain-containing protein n=1 Tax=Rhizodiscina lignyota TaxID=1504668 RepID=A0A9P4M8D8_9PEZI|nr:hypothetical protein NA57DRAFT_78310 [Rhizodiscina lignyota]
MPVTEIVFAHFKDDASLFEERRRAIPEAFKFFSTVQGTLSQNAGIVLRENNVDISKEERAVLALEWESLEQFYDVIKGPGFADFRQKIAPFAAKPATIETYSNDGRSIDAITTPVTQILRVKPSADIKACEAEWAAIKDLIKGSSGEARFYSGVGVGSVGGVEGSFLGLIGWDSLTACEKTWSTPSAKERLNKLLATGEASDHIVQLKCIQKP